MKPTDRELIEGAAKYLGYDTSHSWNIERLTLEPPVLGMFVVTSTGAVKTNFNPLESKVDAFDLMIALGCCITTGPEAIAIDGGIVEFHKRDETDLKLLSELTMRAITRAGYKAWKKSQK